MSIQFTETVRININSAHGGNVLYANNRRSNPGNSMKMPWLCLLCKMCDARVCIVLTVMVASIYCHPCCNFGYDELGRLLWTLLKCVVC